ncbi:hypothetical protein [Microbacterium sp. MMO-10]|uniref:hypothetical protein n=1 Tax=Microbacterium sp. MMO-10 TaxID=3081272 RepID=UPI00301A958E
MEIIRELLARGDRTRLSRRLHRRVSLIVDGGGRVPAPSSPVLGRDDVSRALVDLLGPASGWISSIVEVNGAPAVVFQDGSRVAGVLSLRIRACHVSGMWAVVNPDKLRHWNTP